MINDMGGEICELPTGNSGTHFLVRVVRARFSKTSMLTKGCKLISNV
jgi:hypothetical protein